MKAEFWHSVDLFCRLQKYTAGQIRPSKLFDAQYVINETLIDSVVQPQYKNCKITKAFSHFL